MRAAVMGMAFVASAASAGGIEAYRQQASEWLLTGQRLPRDYRVELMAMESADRISAIAYLRRIGLLTGRAWSLDDLLRDPVRPSEVPE
ncbi:hypothetical protein Q4511_14885 [Paracoccus sp. 1_MG-2023]|uniref:hypothetical protein n=1 Tax=unclassified Paracoccus (in: a-proteobacteria) TaxID=2688777 RepID=UPI001C082314|nr:MULTISPECIES: hypothetical protein [unclassified Paracoccus (in: a-proteobacteria)]MBU2956825.1 hypothetical protein [Paracoccus sp. C2R09]MDO6670210.1 hypothetical protein [Paracoccus sp. 1_MG-2023]